MEEKSHIKKALGKCGYPHWALHKANRPKVNQHKASNTSQGTKRPARVTIPYVEGLSDRVKNVFKEFHISASLKPANTLRANFVNAKDKPPKNKASNLVHGVRCGDYGCKEAYVGETKQSLKARMYSTSTAAPAQGISMTLPYTPT